LAYPNFKEAAEGCEEEEEERLESAIASLGV
jgi:hypothetical protein